MILKSLGHSCLAEKYIMGEIIEKRLLTLLDQKTLFIIPFLHGTLDGTISLINHF